MTIGGIVRGRRCAVLALLAGLLLGGSACSPDLDRAHGLDTTIAGINGVSEAEVVLATSSRAERIGVVLDRDLDAAETLGVLRRVAAAAREAGSRGYVLEVRRSLVEDDVLVVDEAFARDRSGKGVVGNWIRVLDALLGEVTYSVEPGSETIEVVSDGAIGHDVAEASRIGYGVHGTTWRFLAAASTFVVSGPVGPRDVGLFDRVQRTVSSSVLPVPATTWRLQRHEHHLLLDLEVAVGGGERPGRISLDQWATDLRPLALAAVSASRYPGRARWIQLSDVTEAGRDTFAVWSSESRPVRGRDPHLRGWDRWWVRLTR